MSGNSSLLAQPGVLEQLGEDLIAAWLHGEHGELGESEVDQWLLLCSSPCSQMPQAEMARMIPVELHAALKRDSRLRGAIDAVLRTKMDWGLPVPWAPEDPLWKISLLPPERLERLALFVGASLLRQHLSRIVDGASVRALRKRMGVDILESVLLGSGREPSFPFDERVGFPDGENPVECLERAAWSCIEKAFSSRSESLQKRIACKLPGSFANGLLLQPLPFATEAESWIIALWKWNGAWL